MLPSFLVNMFWAQSRTDETDNGSKDVAVDHTTSEEAGDWLLITTQQTPIGKEETASYVTTL